MKAQVIRAFRGAPDGDTRTRDFRPGDEISGDLARVAVEEGWAKTLGSAPVNKALGGAPQNATFPGSASVAGRDGGNSGDRAKPDAGSTRKGAGKGKADRRQ